MCLRRILLTCGAVLISAFFSQNVIAYERHSSAVGYLPVGTAVEDSVTSFCLKFRISDEIQGAMVDLAVVSLNVDTDSANNGLRRVVIMPLPVSWPVSASKIDIPFYLMSDTILGSSYVASGKDQKLTFDMTECVQAAVKDSLSEFSIMLMLTGGESSLFRKSIDDNMEEVTLTVHYSKLTSE